MQRANPYARYIAALSAQEQRYEARVQAYELQGATRSDAQAIVDAEDHHPSGPGPSCYPNSTQREAEHGL